MSTTATLDPQILAPKATSVWDDTAAMPTFPELKESLQADVCIVGGGIAGLSTAYCLTQSGRSVVVLDDGRLAGGMTAVTTAHLASAIDDRLFEIERMHGERGARLAAQSHAAAIQRIESIIRAENIRCGFTRLDGYLFRANDDKDDDLLERELDAARRAGLADVSMVERAPLANFDTGPCLRFPHQGQFHPLEYLRGLAKAIERDGGKLFAQSHADEINGGLVARVRVGKHAITAGHVVVATNSPINDLVAIHTKQAPYMTYVIGARVPRGSVTQALYWDTGDPYHYLRLQPGDDEHDLLIVGGEDHKSGQADDTTERHGRLEAWARERFPLLGEVEYVWGGQVMETIDGLAFIGRNPLDEDNVYVVTGDSGMGMTHGTIAGMLLTDLITGRENPWTELYDPARKTLRAAGTFMKESLNMAAQYADWVTGGDVSSGDEIAPNTGAIVRRGLSKIAAFRDEAGTLHECSAVCPHLGCIVAWNQAEQTWDCPCHGSRFEKLGGVINGPANKGLTKLTVERKGGE